MRDMLNAFTRFLGTLIFLIDIFNLLVIVASFVFRTIWTTDVSPGA